MTKLLERRLPWMSQSAIDLMSKWQMHDMTVLEWGSGGSTLFFLDKGATVISIEHDRKWFAKMNEVISQKPEQAKRSRLWLFEPDAMKGAWAGSKMMPDKTFTKYVSGALEALAEDGRRADVVVVDGRARPACLRVAPRLLRPYGIIIIDDANREHYMGGIRLAKKGLFRCIEHKYIGRGPEDHGRTRHTYMIQEIR